MTSPLKKGSLGNLAQVRDSQQNISLTSHKPLRDFSAEPVANKENVYTEAQNSRILRFDEERNESRPISPY